MKVSPSFTSYIESTDAYAVAYQNEREKPLPSKLHSRVQGNIYFELRTKYGSKFDPFQELSFELSHGKPVPDVCLLEKKALILCVMKLGLKKILYWSLKFYHLAKV
jgi:Uma2 family endonuclease